jgi:hypothetical protein
MRPKAWRQSRSPSDLSSQNGRRWAYALLAAFAILTWFAVPHGIGFSWRECDTQAIARNFLTDDFSPLRPRVDWRGDTDGAVECEFPLYQLGIAGILKVCGQAEWPGRLISLLAIIWAGICLHRLLELRCNANGALAGLGTFLAAGSIVLLATRVMPDALSLALALASLTSFVRYLSAGSNTSLCVSMATLAVSALQKPIALQIGWIMFGWTLVLAPQRLRDWKLWTGFAFTVLTATAWLIHGKALGDETGLTFGVISGGDTKFPEISHLLQPGLYKELMVTTLTYGLTVLGALAACGLVVTRNFDRCDAVILIATGCALCMSLRYSYSSAMGPHYHAFAAIAGAWCVARAWQLLPSRSTIFVVIACMTAQGAWRIYTEYLARSTFLKTPSMDIAKSIMLLTERNELMVIRSGKVKHDDYWQRRNNFETPCLLYQTNLKGWVLPLDGFDWRSIEDLKQRGAHLIQYSTPPALDPQTSEWLTQNADVVLDQSGEHLLRLR